MGGGSSEAAPPTLPAAVLAPSQGAPRPRGRRPKPARSPSPAARRGRVGGRGEATWPAKGRGRQPRGGSAPAEPRGGAAAGPTWRRAGGGRPGPLGPLLLRVVPLPLLLLLLDEAEIRAAELGSGGGGDQPRLQQHSRQAQEQGAGHAPAEPRHGREPAGRGGILRGCGLRPRPLARSPARRLPRTPSPAGGGGREAGGGGRRGGASSPPAHVTRAGRGAGSRGGRSARTCGPAAGAKGRAPCGAGAPGRGGLRG